ncbi:MAG: protein phosphatase 2C domain-containing protein [Limisphaerales bacterium]
MSTNPPDSNPHPDPGPNPDPLPAADPADPARWRGIAVSAAGSRHELAGARTQDASAWLGVHGCGVVVIADGLGSARRGALGARFATRAASRFLSGIPDLAGIGLGACARHGIEVAADALARLATKSGIPERDLATTLAVAVSDGRRTGYAQVGDGVLVVRKRGGSWGTLTHPFGEWANETASLADPDWNRWLQSGQLDEPVETMAGLTDGLAWLALRYPAAEPVAGFFDPLEALVRQQEPESSASVVRGIFRTDPIRQRTDDDLTLCLGTRCASS